MNPELKTYLHETIIPFYRAFDPAHQMDHVLTVIQNSLDIAADHDVNHDMVYVIACYHDIGMQCGRQDHHITGGRFLYDDVNLRRFFDESQMMIMKEAVEDHRASKEEPPRTIYGKIIAEADRDISTEIVMLRTVQFGYKHYPNITKQEHIARAYQHILEKYGPDGYLKLWLETKKNREGLNQIHALLKNRKQMEEYLERLYENEKNHRR